MFSDKDLYLFFYRTCLYFKVGQSVEGISMREIIEGVTLVADQGSEDLDLLIDGAP